MRKLFVLFVSILIFASLSWADDVLLTNPETLSVPTAVILQVQNIRLDNIHKTLTVTYRWIAGDGSGPIRVANSDTWDRYWTCSDIADDPSTDAALCVGPGDPWPCCTGAGTGDCDETDTCFSDTFGFTIRAQDVGTRLGLGLRALIWSKMKIDILSPGNDGVFQ